MQDDVITTAGERFTLDMHRELARLVWVRFGRDDQAATMAWRRMMQNTCEVQDFLALIDISRNMP